MIILNHNITDNFDYDEFVCPCCSGLRLVKVFFQHVSLLEGMRQSLNFPISVNSGYRCKKHNAKVGGATDSMHLLFATDIRPSDNDATKLEQLKEAAASLFKGIGIASNFVHCDLRDKPARWTY